MSSRCRSLVGYTIDMHESEFSEATAVSMRRQCPFRLYYIESQEGLVPQPP